MIGKKIQYKDLEGNNVVDEFWFHLSIAETLEMEMEVEGRLSARVQRMIDSKDETQVLSTLRGIVTRAVGVKSTDGRRFLKEKEHKSAFLDSDAYSKFLVELMTVPGAAIEFVNGVVPSDLEETAKSVQATQAAQVPTSTMTSVPESHLSAAAFRPADENRQAVNVVSDRDYTDWRTYSRAELLAMDNDMFEAVGGKVKPGVDNVLMGIAFERRNNASTTLGGA